MLHVKSKYFVKNDTIEWKTLYSIFYVFQKMRLHKELPKI